MELERVNTNQNISDLLTKPLPEAAADKHLQAMSLKTTMLKAVGAKQLI